MMSCIIADFVGEAMKKTLQFIFLIGLIIFCGFSAVGQSSLDEQLYRAASEDRLDAIQPLLKKGANIEARCADSVVQPYATDDTKRTPLMAAARNGNIDVLQLLLKKGANIEARDDNNNTVLIAAATAGQTEAVKQLLKNGANINAEGAMGETALAAAAEEGKTDVVQVLLDKGADIEATGNVANGTALVLAAKNDHADIVQLLLYKGAKIEPGGSSGYETALTRAASNGYTDVVRLLLAKDANIEARNSLGQTALIEAAASGKTAVTGLLLEKGANIEARSNDGGTALLWAAFLHHTYIAQLLLDKGADLEARTNDGETPLIAAACFETETDSDGTEKVNLVKLLLDMGADLDAANKDAMTPLNCPNRLNPPAVADLLEQASQQRKKLEEALSDDHQTAFGTYLSLFNQNPRNEYIRRKIIGLVTTLPQQPPIPEEAQRLYVLATTQIKQDSSPQALAQPIGLLRHVLVIAPWWGNAYLSLSGALEKSGKYDDATQQLKYYLDLKPPEGEASEARVHLAVIKAEKDAAARKPQ
jgi:ankyrin repeat protein